jgi:hypothetical protein
MKTLHFLRNAARCFWLCFAALLSLALAGVAEAQSLKPLILKWDYPTNTMSDSFTFKLYSQTSLNIPLTNWVVVGTYPATNWYTNGLCIAPVQGTNHTFTVTNMTLPGVHQFHYVTVSNFWGDRTQVTSLRYRLCHPRARISSTARLVT